MGHEVGVALSTCARRTARRIGDAVADPSAEVHTRAQVDFAKLVRNVTVPAMPTGAWL
jgi:hypothetical protein